MFSMQSLSKYHLIVTFQLSSAASLNLGQSQNGVCIREWVDISTQQILYLREITLILMLRIRTTVISLRLSEKRNNNNTRNFTTIVATCFTTFVCDGSVKRNEKYVLG